MELLYLWIDDYKGLSNIGINLSNQFRFDFKPDKNTLNILPANNYVSSFFADNVSNFTGIIGINSAGKTSVLRYILEYCSHGTNYEKEKAKLVIFKLNQQFFYYSVHEIKFIQSSYKELFKKEKDLDKLKWEKQTVYLSTHFDPTSFYSNDYTRTQLGDTKNLSTWYLLHTDIQFRKNVDTNRRDITFDERISAFAAQEFIRIVRLLRWIKKEDSTRNPFLVEDIPPYLNIALYFNYETPNKVDFDSLAKKLQEYFKIRSGSKNIFLLRAFEAAIFHFIDEKESVMGLERIQDHYSQIHSHILKYLEATKPLYKDKDASIITDLKNICNDLGKVFPLLSNRIVEITDFLNSLYDFIQKQHAELHNDGVLTLKLKSVGIKSLLDFVDAFYKIDRIGTFAEFYFSHLPGAETSLSSGEYAMLSLFGRLNSLKIDAHKAILLLIDEAELALHPQWQKQFISIFLNFISERFKDHKVQVILTSHSPFILSDMPPHCVILLKKDKDGTKAIDSLETQKETFGANIHELFTDSFFLQDGLMGEFARDKIDKLIKEIQKETETITIEKYNTVYRRRVDIIGERFLKTKILELIASKADLETVDAIIGIRSDELRILNEIRNKKYDQNRKS